MPESSRRVFSDDGGRNGIMHFKEVVCGSTRTIIVQRDKATKTRTYRMRLLELCGARRPLNTSHYVVRDNFCLRDIFIDRTDSMLRVEFRPSYLAHALSKPCPRLVRRTPFIGRDFARTEVSAQANPSLVPVIPPLQESERRKVECVSSSTLPIFLSNCPHVLLF